MELDDDRQEAAFEVGQVMLDAMADEVWRSFKESIAYELAYRLVEEATDRMWDRLEQKLKQIEEELDTYIHLQLEDLIERWFVVDKVDVADKLAAHITRHLEAVDNEAVKRAVKEIWGPETEKTEE